jgi:2-hydroxychromene-2-carboxylate isomerase
MGPFYDHRRRIQGVSALSTIEFWYDFASPYCYISASRIESLLKGLPIELTWRPFLLGPIFQKNQVSSPPVVINYRRRDVERLCESRDMPLVWPSTYPRFSLLASRVAVYGSDDPWGPEFTKAVFHANFVEDRDIGSEATVREILEEIGLNANAVIAGATTAENKALLISQVDKAIEKGIFGAPTFVADGEVFWGDDRLEQAISWALKLHPAQLAPGLTTAAPTA